MSLLWIATALLFTASMVSFVIAHLSEATSNGRFWAEVHENLSLGVEFNLPTWFSSILWGLFGLVAWYLSTVDAGRRPSWLIVAAVGWVASIDEALMLHDRLSRPGSAIEEVLGIDLDGATWVLVGIVVVGAVAALLARFVLSLPSKPRRDLIVGGGLFLTGAVGFEVISSLAFEATGTVNWLFMVTMHIEEFLEFAGVIVATRGLLRLLPPGTGREPDCWHGVEVGGSDTTTSKRDHLLG